MKSPEDQKIDEIISKYPEKWKTYSAFMSYLRGGIRRGLWNKHPLKLEFFSEQRVRIPNTNPRSMKAHPTVWGGQCSICKGVFKDNFLEVDHVKEKGSSFKEYSDLSNFVTDMVLITKEDLRIVCKDCHTIVNHQQATGYSFEKAKKDKEFIEIKKTKEFESHLRKLGVTEIPKYKKDQEKLLRELMLESYNE